jgi:excisionase family DNA binding protein
MSVSGWITSGEVMEILGVTRNRITYLIRRGNLHPVKSGNRYVFREDEVRNLTTEDLGAVPRKRHRGKFIKGLPIPGISGSRVGLILAGDLDKFL